MFIQSALTHFIDHLSALSSHFTRAKLRCNKMSKHAFERVHAFLTRTMQLTTMARIQCPCEKTSESFKAVDGDPMVIKLLENNFFYWYCCRNRWIRFRIIPYKQFRVTWAPSSQRQLNRMHDMHWAKQKKTRVIDPVSMLCTWRRLR